MRIGNDANDHSGDGVGGNNIVDDASEGIDLSVERKFC